MAPLIYIYPRGGRDTVLVIFGGKIRSCKLFSSQDLMSADATRDFLRRLLVSHVYNYILYFI